MRAVGIKGFLQSLSVQFGDKSSTKFPDGRLPENAGQFGDLTDIVSKTEQSEQDDIDEIVSAM